MVYSFEHLLLKVEKNMRQNTEYEIRYLKTDDLEQYNSLLRYASR